MNDCLDLERRASGKNPYPQRMALDEVMLQRNIAVAKQNARPNGRAQ